ncbi:MAG: hypothetical protein LBD80_07145 [Tannerella sp.]|jgi:acetyltransferase-like isoleucine patch superfamily enzyme|nr:hypothetical protein [Tannerella sp.]
MNAIINLSKAPVYIIDKFLSYFCKKAMKSCGKNVYLRPLSSDFKGLWNMSIGNHVSIPRRSTLKGVTVGRGSVIAAGYVINRSCLPYSIIGGILAKLLKFRFAVDEILEHEAILYPDEKRFTRDELTTFRGKL